MSPPLIDQQIVHGAGQIRWKKFRQQIVAMVSLGLLCFFLFLSLTAEFWANNRPLLMKYQGQIYFPVFFETHPSDLGQTDLSQTDYRALQPGAGDWSLWPVIRWNPYESNPGVDHYPSPPTSSNWLGTDEHGRDVVARLLYGLRTTMIFAFGSWILTSLLGSLLGAIMGYFAGWMDLVGMRIVEIVECLPMTFILLTVISVCAPNLGVLILLMTVVGWTNSAIYVRAQFLSLRNSQFIEGARALGATPWQIMLKHLLPNSLTPLVTFAPLTIASYISLLSYLDYLGLGLTAPTPSWGELLSEAQHSFGVAEWLVWGPVSVLVLTLILLMNVGTALRNALDPMSETKN